MAASVEVETGIEIVVVIEVGAAQTVVAIALIEETLQGSVEFEEMFVC